jgi:hypothetical protein
MASPEEAISTALGNLMDPSKILAWTNDLSTGQLKIIYDGPEPVTSENTTVIVLNAHADE